MSRLIPAMIALSCAGLAAGADGIDISDLRAALGVSPMPDTRVGTVTGSSSPSLVGMPVKETYQSTPGLGASIQVAFGHLAPVGLVYGGEMRYVNGRQRLTRWQIGNTTPVSTNTNTDSFSYSSVGLAANIGIGAALSPTWHVELVGIAGLEYINAESPAFEAGNGGNIVSNNSKGHAITRGGRLGGYWTDPESRWQYGLELEYTHTEGPVEASYGNATIRYDALIAEGFGAKVSIGTRF